MIKICVALACCLLLLGCSTHPKDETFIGVNPWINIQHHQDDPSIIKVKEPAKDLVG